MDPHIEICDEKAISIFLGKCVESDGFEICPNDPVVVEHLQTEEAQHGCLMSHRGVQMCPEDLDGAFRHGDCFRVDHKFICEEDMDFIRDAMCVDVNQYHVCDHDLYDLFAGENVITHDGHHLAVDFATPHHDPHSALCREHEGMEFCLEDILELYEAPHDCVKFADEWIC